MKKEKCKTKVPEPGSTQYFNQCKNSATKDGYCWQHHPDAKKECTQKATEDKWECWCCVSKVCKVRKEETWKKPLK